ncbi:hypothetical protein [Actinokineospora bangkokensis]|uniref:APA family basic amino acid/polyamine antiporter n=1 Tax=Actinokineospora bangkokensis TaxID=1193682 RepID=A0A1Q9LT96_9PSEU|nr:hypothetical protein [Actinokineospora bangkokensis]OLR95256.1 hypothetical protein BJP25_07145 [Actinokineospora bangkokensis]
MTAVGHAPVGARAAALPAAAAALAAGVLVATGPSIAAAGWWALPALGLAGVVALLTAVSRADLHARFPATGEDAHVRARFGGGPGRIAEVFALAGRVVAAAAVAGAAGAYLWPPRPLYGAGVVLLVAAVSLVARVELPPSTGTAARVVAILTVVGFVVVGLGIAPALPAVAAPAGVPGVDDPTGVLVAAGVLTLGFTGTGGSPSARAAAGSVLGVLVLMGAAVFTVLHQLGGPRAALSTAPLRDALVAADGAGLDPALTAGLALGALLAVRALLVGAGSAAAQLAAHGELPGRPRHHLAALVVACAALVVALPTALAAEVAACLLLGHAALLNAAARSLTRAQRSTWVRTGCCGIVLSVVVGVNTSLVGLAAAAGVALLGGVAWWALGRRPVT